MELNTKLFQFNEEQYTSTLNRAKEWLAYKMWKEGVITVEQYNKIVGEYAIVIRSKGMLGSVIGKLLGEPDSDAHVRWTLVKVCTEGEKDCTASVGPNPDRFADVGKE